MDIAQLITEYLGQSRMMQLATVRGDQPWNCTVGYVADDHQCLYWLSLPTRRHSQEITAHDRVAVAIPIKFDKRPLVGIQAEGRAEAITDNALLPPLIKLYMDRFHRDQQFYDDFLAGKNQQLLYRFTPERFALFDEVNFPNDSYQTWVIKEGKEM
jgi:uncharacterized protein YhbP (UPF0306 family)